jgi:hypothetical protein
MILLYAPTLKLMLRATVARVATMLIGFFITGLWRLKLETVLDYIKPLKPKLVK